MIALHGKALRTANQGLVPASSHALHPYIHTYIKMYLNTLALTSFDDVKRSNSSVQGNCYVEIIRDLWGIILQ
jgi:hypothetical protein